MSDTKASRRLVVASSALAVALAGCGQGEPPTEPNGQELGAETEEARQPAQARAEQPGDGEAQGPRATLTVEQESGNTVYWVMPGPRALSEEVFGTPDDPQMLFEPKLAAAREAVDAGRMPPTVPGLLQELPLLVGIPEGARTMVDGQWVFQQPNPFSDQARIVEGSFTATYEDYTDTDPPGPPGETPDSAQFESEFTDPAGNDYRLVLDHVVKPPFPGYETEGGVMIDSRHHGTTGTGTPLMPEVETHGAFWGVGELYVNGELVQPAQVFHVMTTEPVRDRDYRLVQQADLPLPSEERHIAEQAHHTHVMVLPITPVPGEGPSFEPVPTAFELPNGDSQPFMHIMFEEDELSE